MTVPANYFPINGASPSGGSIITSIPWGFDSGELEFFAYRDSDGALEKSPTYSLSGSTLTVSNPFGSVAWSLFVSRRGDITQDVEDGVNNAQAIISQLDQLTKRTQEVGASSEGAVRFHGKLEPMVLPSVDERKGKIVGFDDVTGDLKVNPASADLAGSYAVASAASAAKAEAALNDVVTRYIGAFADDSAANAFASGEGIALADGTEYFKTGTGKRIYSGGVWMDAVNGLTEVSGDGRYLQKDQNGADISEAGSFRDNIGVFSRGLIRGRARTPLAEQPGVEPEGPLMPVTLTEAEFEALTEYEPRYYDVLGIGTYFGPKRIAWDTDVYDSSTGIHVATTGDDSTGDGSVGNPYLTISKGWDIAVAANGGTVWVHAGEYAENVSAGYFLKNAAAPSSTVTIRGVPGEKIIWTNTATGAYVFRLTGACSNITIRNVTFRQAYASGSGFVYCNDASNALSALQLIECHFDGAVNRATYFIQLVGAGGSSGVKVKRCSMTAAGTGMSTIFSNHVGLEVVGNSFVNTASATSWFGVRLNAGNSGNIYLNSNYMRGADGDGINQDTAFTGTAAVVARRNEVILTTGGDGLYLYGGSATYPATVDIRRNRITVPSGNGLVVVQAVSGGTMENNRVVAGADRVMNCGADGVGLEPVENVVVRHNHAIGQDAGTTHTLLIGPFSSGITADYNIVDGSDGAHYGLVFKGANSSFTDSIIYGGTDSALYLKGTDTCTVSRCLVVQNQSTVDATLEFQDGSALEPLVDSSVTECIFELTAGKLYGFGAGSTHLSTGNVINSNAYLLSGTATWGTMFASAVTSLAEVRASWAANYDVTTNDADSTDE